MELPLYELRKQGYDGPYASSVAYDGPNLYAVSLLGSPSGLPLVLARSMDGGASWREARKLGLECSGPCTLSVKARGGEVFLLVVDESATTLYYSADDGNTWRPSGLPRPGSTWLRLSRGRPGDPGWVPARA